MFLFGISKFDNGGYAQLPSLAWLSVLAVGVQPPTLLIYFLNLSN